MHTKTRGQPATIVSRPVRGIEIGPVHYSLNSHILFYSNGLPIEHSMPCIVQILVNDAHKVEYPSLKPHILFDGNGLAIWHSFPDITHIYGNNSLKSAILNLIELSFFKPCPCTFCFMLSSIAIWLALPDIRYI